MESRMLRHNKSLPLLHQLQPQRLRLLQADREIIHIIKHMVPQLSRETREPPSLPVQSLDPPVLPLARHVRRRYDADIRVDKEEREDLAVARRRGVCEVEGLDFVLQDVGPREEPPFLGVDDADVLNGRLFVLAAEDYLEPVVLALGVGYLLGVPGVRLLAEREVAWADVGAIVVVQSRGAYVFVL